MLRAVAGLSKGYFVYPFIYVYEYAVVGFGEGSYKAPELRSVCVGKDEISYFHGMCPWHCISVFRYIAASFTMPTQSQQMKHMYQPPWNI